jgi:hypothetical protein
LAALCERRLTPPDAMNYSRREEGLRGKDNRNEVLSTEGVNHA